MGPRNRFQGMNSASLCSLAGRYDNPLPPRFLAPIDSLKISALAGRYGYKKRRISYRFSNPLKKQNLTNTSKRRKAYISVTILFIHISNGFEISIKMSVFLKTLLIFGNNFLFTYNIHFFETWRQMCKKRLRKTEKRFFMKVSLNYILQPSTV